ncbi:DUF4268 domain-containing protein [Oceanibium sediminis]|uniref:DUF4268 domain-containing protein n=1 Tax=Oceanibium sediminis TaxID=2026339 RepID=UPI000DD4E4BF|nr:DUF4268 domain-containing protein [Oceanibium sediminis]
MFQINRNDNCLNRLEERTFSELNFREREHLQEWLAQMPDALGEELLIIQKEFDGFDDTRERLDLLALDRDGHLVVIENKLDDTGRNVIWQALKYAAYCSNMTKSQIVEIYQKYLDRYEGGGGAANRICEFLEVEELDELVLNPGTSQRVIFVAANFRKEVTATALWLLGSGIRIQCYTVKPYSFGEELLLDIRQIIPTPEAEEYMIGITSKETEEKQAYVAKKGRYNRRVEFWQQLFEQMRSEGVSLFQNVSPGKGNWLAAGSGSSGCPFVLIYNQKVVQVQVEMNTGDKFINKEIFDNLHAQKDQIEEVFGAPLLWQRLDDRKQARVRVERTIDGLDEENWPAINRWMIDKLVKLELAIRRPLNEAANHIKTNATL